MGALDKLIDTQRMNAASVANAAKSDTAYSQLMAVIARLLERDTDDLTNNQLAKGIVASLESMQGRLEKAVKSLDSSKANGELAVEVKAIAKAQAALAKQVAAIKMPEKTDLSAVIKAVDALRTAIQTVKMPETDLTPVLKELAGMKSATPVASTDEQWEFTPERDDFSGRITKVTGMRVA